MDDLSRLRVETRMPAHRGDGGGGAVAAVTAPTSPLGGPPNDAHSARFPASKTKLDNLFLQWLSLPESQKLVSELVGGGGGGGEREKRGWRWS